MCGTKIRAVSVTYNTHISHKNTRVLYARNAQLNTPLGNFLNAFSIHDGREIHVGCLCNTKLSLNDFYDFSLISRSIHRARRQTTGIVGHRRVIFSFILLRNSYHSALLKKNCAHILNSLNSWIHGSRYFEAKI